MVLLGAERECGTFTAHSNVLGHSQCVLCDLDHMAKREGALWSNAWASMWQGKNRNIDRATDQEAAQQLPVYRQRLSCTRPQGPECMEHSQRRTQGCRVYVIHTSLERLAN